MSGRAVCGMNCLLFKKMLNLDVAFETTLCEVTEFCRAVSVPTPGLFRNRNARLPDYSDEPALLHLALARSDLSLRKQAQHRPR